VSTHVQCPSCGHAAANIVSPDVRWGELYDGLEMDRAFDPEGSGDLRVPVRRSDLDSSSSGSWRALVRRATRAGRYLTMLGLMKRRARRPLHADLGCPSGAGFRFRVYASRWNWVVFHLLGIRHRATRVTFEEGLLRVECSCGERAQFRGQLDGSGEVVQATCKRWLYLQQVQRALLPRATARVADPTD
jgi:hypothetical protein